MASRLKTILFVMALVSLAACHTVQAEQETAVEMPTLAADATDVERVIDALARAEQASATGNTAELARQVSLLDALGARFESIEDQRDIARWRAEADMPPPMRGPVGGPAVRRGSIASGTSVEFGQAFLAGERASLAIQAREGPSIELRVADGQDAAVCTRHSRRGSCVWTPVFTQRHSIRLTNNGSTTAQYHLVIE